VQKVPRNLGCGTKVHSIEDPDEPSRPFPEAKGLALAALISVAPAGAQTITPQTQDSSTTRRQLAEFDRFLDSHPEVASQLRQDPSLVNNP
jgi:hypothetical protein